MSVKKLEEERQNLVRVNDILAELEKQIGPLEKQSEVAREYLKKKESLKTYDINLFLLETERLKKEIAAVDHNLEETYGKWSNDAVFRMESAERWNAVETAEG